MHLYTAEFLSLLAGRRAVGEATSAVTESERLCRKIRTTIQESYLDRLILFGEESLRTALQQFVTYYHTERPHQGLAADRLICPEPSHHRNTGAVQRRERLGGLLNYYRAA